MIDGRHRPGRTRGGVTGDFLLWLVAAATVAGFVHVLVREGPTQSSGTPQEIAERLKPIGRVVLSAPAGGTVASPREAPPQAAEPTNAGAAQPGRKEPVGDESRVAEGETDSAAVATASAPMQPAPQSLDIAQGPAALEPADAAQAPPASKPADATPPPPVTVEPASAAQVPAAAETAEIRRAPSAPEQAETTQAPSETEPADTAQVGSASETSAAPAPAARGPAAAIVATPAADRAEATAAPTPEAPVNPEAPASASGRALEAAPRADEPRAESFPLGPGHRVAPPRTAPPLRAPLPAWSLPQAAAGSVPAHSPGWQPRPPTYRMIWVKRYDLPGQPFELRPAPPRSR